MTVASATSFAITRPTATQAGEKPPIVVAVEDHEERITTLETKTDDIKHDVDQTKEDVKYVNDKVDKKATTQGPVQVERVTTVVREPAATITPDDYPITPNNPPAPVINPWTVKHIQLSMRDDTAIREGQWLKSCTYVFENGKAPTFSGTVYLDASGNIRYTTSAPKCELAVGEIANPVWLKNHGLN